MEICICVCIMRIRNVGEGRYLRTRLVWPSGPIGHFLPSSFVDFSSHTESLY